LSRIVTYGLILLIGLAVGSLGSALIMGFAPSARTTSVMTVMSITITTQTANSIVGQQIVEYCFSPGGNCDQVLIKYINQARSSIHIMIYEFTLKDIESALVNARSRGVEVKLVMDRSESQISSSLYSDLKLNGFDVRIGSVAGILHDKVAIIDDQYVIEGSFNYSYSAVAYNAENLVVISDPTIANAYEGQFQQLYNSGV
jgi:phosphatidylserine/phosphatidylglycerophosphate/cardiolipin synthase-like enzyme